MGNACGCLQQDRRRGPEVDDEACSSSSSGFIPVRGKEGTVSPDCMEPPGAAQGRVPPEVVRLMDLVGPDGEALAYESHRVLDRARQQIMATAFPECEPRREVIAVVARRLDGTKREFVAVVQDNPGSPPRPVSGSCQITYEDITPSECVEYCFGEAPSQWAMTQLSLDALETYRGTKFEAWKGMLVHPTCEAQFRRMLQIGMVSELYDPHVFPTPESLKSKYQVTDERTGKPIELPHPVSALRVWDAQRQAYRALDTQLKGAPAPVDRQSWWERFIRELSEKHGQEYVDGLMQGR